MSPVKIDYIGEGPTDAAVARRLIGVAGGEPGQDLCTPRRGRGKDQLDTRIAGLNARAGHGHIVLVLRDLDHDALCPGALRERLIPGQNSRLCLRIAARSVEAWLLADYRAFAGAIGVAARLLSQTPEQLASPKLHIITLAKQSTRTAVRQDVLPTRRSGRAVGPGYAAWLIEFTEQQWDPRRAAVSGRSPSLTKALARLQEVVTAAHR